MGIPLLSSDDRKAKEVLEDWFDPLRVHDIMTILCECTKWGYATEKDATQIYCDIISLGDSKNITFDEGLKKLRKLM